MTKTIVLDPLITRVSVIREVVIKISESLILFLMVRVNINSSRSIIMGRFKVGEVLLIRSSASNVVYLDIMLQSVLRSHVTNVGKLGIRLMNVRVMRWFVIIVKILATLVLIVRNLRRHGMSKLVERFLLSVMLFGVSNAPGVFMEYMNRTFHP